MSTQNEWGLTERGFRRPTYTELLDALEYKARELFGSKANLTVRSPIGLFLRIFAWILNMLFSTIEDVYNSRFVDTAVGTSLYNLGKAIGLKLLSEQKSSGYLQITGTPGTIVPVGWLAGTVAGLQFVVMAQGEIGTGGTVLLPAQATTAGPEGNVAAGTVTVVINPGIPEGITAVTNPAAFDGGRARETDEEYRDRYYQSVDYAGGVNADAIRGEILQNVEGVYSAIVYENDTDETDSEGLPPHSIEAVVYGGLDSDVAQQIFRRKAAGMSDMISQLLFLSRADQGRQPIHRERLDLSELTEMIVEEQQMLADSAGRGIRVESRISPGVEADADETLYIRMVSNLLSNAVRYSHDGGKVEVILEERDGEVRGRVKDHGVGIAAEDLPRVWERFYRADSSRTETSHSGLGLSMVRWIAHAHGGDVSVASEAGKGSEFAFYFPAREENEKN